MAGWINVDGSWGAHLAKHPALERVLRVLRLAPAPAISSSWAMGVIVHDVRKPLPFTAGSISTVYASHLLEHLYLVEADALLEECFRVLEPGGVIRIVVPDLESLVREYFRSKSRRGAVADQDGNPADALNRKLLFRSPTPPSGPLLYRAYSGLKDFHTHKWMYDRDSLAAHLRRAGFIEIGHMPFHQSRIVGIEAIEQASRVLNGEGICLEGIKPYVTT